MGSSKRDQLRALAGVLRLGAHILARDPSQIFNQLVGRLDPRICPHHLRSPLHTSLQLLSQSLRAPNQPLTAYLLGHTAGVTCAAFSPESDYLVTGSSDKTARVWDVRTGVCVQILPHPVAITACAYRPVQQGAHHGAMYVLTASEAGHLTLWNLDTATVVRSYPGFGYPVNSCAFAPDGATFVTAAGSALYHGADADDTVRLWNVETGACEAILTDTLPADERLQDRVVACAVSADGRYALSGDGDQRLRLWDLITRQWVSTRWALGSVTACAFTPDGRFALSAADDVLQLWEVRAGNDGARLDEVGRLRGHGDRVTSLSVTPDGRYALSTAHDKTLRVWDMTTGQSLRTLTDHTDWTLSCAISPDRSLAASTALDGTVLLWKLDAILTPEPGDSPAAQEQETWHSVRVFAGRDENFDDCAFSPNGRTVLSASSWFDLQLWDTASGATIRAFPPVGDSPRWVRACAYSPDGRLILSAHANGLLALRNAESAELVRTYEGHQGEVRACVFSPDGAHILSGSADHTLRLWETSSGACVQTLEGHTEAILACAISPDGALAASGSNDWAMRIWDLKTGKSLHECRKWEPERNGYSWQNVANDCAFSPDGQFVATASEDGTVALWRVADGSLVRTYTGHSKDVNGCAFSPDGGRIASCSSDQSVRLWDVESAVCLRIYRGHEGSVYSCAFSPDGRFILSASHDKTLRLWDATVDQTPHGHQQPVLACRYSPDGRLALTASEDRSVRLWDVATQRVQRIFAGHTKQVNDCAFSPDGTRALSVSDDFTLRLWDVHSGVPEWISTHEMGPKYRCALSPDGVHMLSLAPNRRVMLWDLATKTVIKIFHGSRDSYRQVVLFTQDGRFVLTSSVRRTLALWDVVQARDAPTHRGRIGPMDGNRIGKSFYPHPPATVVSADGRLAVSVYFEQRLAILWDVHSGKELHYLANPSPFSVENVSFSPNATLVMGMTADRSLRLWAVKSGQQVAAWPADNDLLCCAFHPDSQHIIAGDRSGALHFLVLRHYTAADASPPDRAVAVRRRTFWPFR